MRRTLLDYNLKIRLPITLFVIAATFALTYYVSRTEREGIGYQPEQPIKFSHKLHAGDLGIDCKYCHTGVTKGRHALIPAVSTCVNCHSVARRDKEQILKLFDYYIGEKPIEWERVHKVPDYVYFNHSVHVNKGIDCSKCHGDVARMETVRQVASFTMGACLDCHRNAHKKLPEIASTIKKGPENCNACHR